MIRSCLHTHTTFCDGLAPPEDYPPAALKAGLSVLGFSGHSPLPWINDWTMKAEDLSPYADRIGRLKTEWADRLEILLGMELDWLPEYPDRFIPHPDVAGYDYRIGSLHSIPDPADNRYYAVDGPEEELLHLINHVFGGSTRQLVEAYTERLAGMIRHGGFEILGHMDLPKKRNRGDRYFNEGESWYRNAFGAVIEELAGTSLVTEINTGGMARGYTESPYPSLWILKELRARNLPVMINADAHNPEQLTYGYDKAEHLAREAGFRELRILTGGEWKEIPLGEA